MRAESVLHHQYQGVGFRGMLHYATVGMVHTLYCELPYIAGITHSSLGKASIQQVLREEKICHAL